MTKITLEIPEAFAEFCKEQQLDPENILRGFMLDLVSGAESDGKAEAWFNSIEWHDQDERSYEIRESEEGGYVVRLFDMGDEVSEKHFPLPSMSKALAWWDESSEANRNFWLGRAQEKHPDVKPTVEMAYREYAESVAYEEAYNYGENWAPA